MTTRALAVAGLCSTLAAPAFADAQSEHIQQLEKKLESSIALIEQLSTRVAELERNNTAAARPTSASTTATPPNPDTIHAIAALQDTVSQLSESMGRQSGDNGVPLHGFADVGAAWSSGSDPVKLRGFNGGTLDLYLTPTLGQRVKSLVELAVEYGTDNSVGIDMERLQLGYTVSDAVTVWAGRFHTPIGLWNTSFHHGANLQTSIYRPRFVDFEDKGGIIPAHSVGVWASGKTSMAGGRLTYDGYLANGPHISGRTLDFGAFTDDNAGKALGANVGFQFGGKLTGFTLGLHALGFDSNALATSGAVLNQSRVRMTGAYAGYDADDWEAIAEYYGFANSDLISGAHHASQAWFGQVGKTFGSATPFVRYEKAALSTADNFFRSQESGTIVQAHCCRPALRPGRACITQVRVEQHERGRCQPARRDGSHSTVPGAQLSSRRRSVLGSFLRGTS